jgi:hypothetical protein
MPVRSLTQSVLRWPQPEQVLEEARAWADEKRLCCWPLERLPLSCDALVLTPTELEQLLGGSSRMAQELQSDLVWLD